MISFYHYSEINLIFVLQQDFSDLHKFFNSLCGQCNILHSLYFWFWFWRCYLFCTCLWFQISLTAIHLLLHCSFPTKHSWHSWLTTMFKTNLWLHLIKWQPQPTNLWPQLMNLHPWFTTLHLWPLIQSWICHLPFTEVYISMYILHFSPHGHSKSSMQFAPTTIPFSSSSSIWTQYLVKRWKEVVKWSG